jgi:protein SCO1/2
MLSVSSKTFCLMVLLASVCAARLYAQDRGTSVSETTIPDVELTDQNGHKLHFYSDLVKGKVVAINTVFTTCDTICPVMGARFASLSRLLAKEDTSRVELISISVDPLVDTPARLKEWSHQFGHVGTHWVLLTGRKDDVDHLLKALEIFTPDKVEHTPVVLIGSGGTTQWSRASALSPPTRLAELMRARLTMAATK